MPSLSPTTLHTPRLLLRPFTPADAAEAARLAGDREVASTTLRIPHPYDAAMAADWIATHEQLRARGVGAVFAMVERRGDALVGSIGLTIECDASRAELGYWVGKPYWGRGYATEAAGALLRYAFDDLALNRVFAMYFSRNPASGRVMQKLGMTYEGRLRGHDRKWGVFEDVEIYGILASEWRASALVGGAGGEHS
jgi:RimJ/RimL family protein N-acetyltransferase